MNYNLLIVVNMIIAICILVFMLIKQKIFYSLRDGIVILSIGLIIMVVLLTFVFYGLDWGIHDVVGFLLLKKHEDYWSLTKICLISYFAIYCGIIALTLSILQRERK